MQIPRRKIVAALRRKGFIKEEGSRHTYLYHKYRGKHTGISTYVSRGTQYKDYGDALIDKMRKELRLINKAQIVNLVGCPLDADGYNSILRTKGFI